MEIPIYVKTDANEIARSLAKLHGLLKEIESETAFLSTKEPTLYAVLAPEEDCISVGKIKVLGVSDLSEDQKVRIKETIASVLEESIKEEKKNGRNQR